MIIETQASGSFRFDPGPNPRIGQTWNIDQPVTFLGSKFLFKTITMTANTYSIAFDYPAGSNPAYIVSVGILGPDGSENVAASSFTSPTGERDIVGYESGHLPGGPLTIEMSAYKDAPLAGPWTIVWSPPANP